jgi:hypothetical protein
MNNTGARQQCAPCGEVFVAAKHEDDMRRTKVHEVEIVIEKVPRKAYEVEIVPQKGSRER